MAEPSLIRSQDFPIWVNHVIALNVTCYGVSEYLKSGIQKLHHDLKYGPCAGLSPCQKNCSKTKSAWCNSCNTWKEELRKYTEHDHFMKINWKKFSSAKWPTNVEEMVKVFAPYWWDNNSRYWEDLCVVLSIFYNCKIFTLPETVCNPVKKLRNEYAHLGPEMTKIKYDKCLKDLNKLLNLEEIRQTRAGKIAKKKIKWLKKNNINITIHRGEEFDFRLIIKAFHKIQKFQPYVKEIRDHLNCEYDRTTLHLKQLDNSNTKEKNSSVGKWSSIIVCLLMILFVVFYYQSFNEQFSSTFANGDCLKISSSFPWQFKIDMGRFLVNHSMFVGRRWLIEDMKDILNLQNRGILLTAEMGYGKSVLVSHIVCSYKESPAYDIKKKTLYYHVCKYDVLTTQRVDIFIKNIIAMLMLKHPSIGNAIYMDDTAMKYLEAKLCIEDPSGCFDYALISPLIGIEYYSAQYVIIDALDECYENEYTKGKLSLWTLLANRGDRLPKWMQLIVTSRIPQNLHMKFNFLLHYPLNASDNRNIEDIINFIQSNFKKPSNFIVGINPSNNTITKILQISGGNFLFVVQALKVWSSSENYDIEYVPDSLNKLYSSNLQRVFGNSFESFDLARQVFELMCTTSKSLTEEDVKALLYLTPNNAEKLKRLIENELSHFIRRSRGLLTVNHKAICDFLTDPANIQFHISQENGHKLFAQYLFSLGIQAKTDNELIDLIVHVSESRDNRLLSALRKDFKVLLLNQTSDESLIHKFSQMKNSYEGAKFLINTFPDIVNKLNENGISAAYYAAAFGNAETLTAIMEEGGDLYFKVKTPPLSFQHEDVISYCKLIAHCNYSLLDIAAQNGHLKTVEIILNYTLGLTKHKNGIGLNALHLASEQGHALIVKTLLDVNESLADQQALYLAAKNGHSECVSLLIDSGVKDTCVKCDGTVYWLKQNNTQIRTFLGIEKAHSHWKHTDTIIDDEIFRKCCSALEIAVQLGHYDVVKLLLSQKLNALHCREYGGRTPVLTAVKYHRPRIFKYLIDWGANESDQCLHNPILHQSEFFLSYEDYSKSVEDLCSNGTGIPHFIAKYVRDSMYLTMYKYHIQSSKFWEVKNDVKASPLHFAACHNNHLLIYDFRQALYSNILDRTINGSSPFHSAVVCRSQLSLHNLRELKYDGLFAVDKKNRNLMHYLCKEPYNQYYSDNEDLIMLDLLGEATASEKKHFYQVDLRGENFLHYAAKNGKYNVLEQSLNFLEEEITDLLLTKNRFGQNVFDIAVIKLPKTEIPFGKRIIPNFNEIIFSKCFSRPEITWSHREIFLKRLLDIRRKYEIRTMNITSIWRKVIVQGNAAATSMLWEMMDEKPRIEDFVSDLFASDTNLLTIGLFLQYGNFSCGKTFQGSFLHRLLMNEGNRYWFVATHLLDSLKIALSKKSIHEWERCFDADGYNIIKRASMGGNSDIVKFLIKIGMRLKKD